MLINSFHKPYYGIASNHNLSFFKEQDKFRDLLITEEIVPPLLTSSSENTPESYQTGNQDTLVPNTGGGASSKFRK